MTDPTLGFRGSSEFEDMSDYLVHLTRDVEGRTAYDNAIRILYERQLRPGPSPFGFAARFAGGDPSGRLRETMRAVCFTETPLPLLNRFVPRRSQYGLGFRREFIAKAGGVPVWLPELGTPAATLLNTFAETTATAQRFDDPFWTIASLIDIPGEYGAKTYRFEWEREWRIRGGLAFSPNDVAFLLVPEAHHAAAKRFFEEHGRAGTGPYYPGPFLDPAWNADRMRKALGRA